MPRLQLAFRTIVTLLVVVSAILMLEIVAEEAATVALLGEYSPRPEAEKWIDGAVTALAILLVCVSAAIFRYRARRVRDILRSQGNILGHMAEAVITTDLAGRVEYWNKGAERLFGFSAAEAIGIRTMARTVARKPPYHVQTNRALRPCEGRDTGMRVP